MNRWARAIDGKWVQVPFPPLWPGLDFALTEAYDEFSWHFDKACFDADPMYETHMLAWLRTMCWLAGLMDPSLTAGEYGV